jgi:hypothetical protein
MSPSGQYVHDAAYGEPGHVYARTDRAGIRSAYAKDGFVVFDALTFEQCQDLVFEQWRRVIAPQPWKDGVRLELRDARDGVLDAANPAHKTEILAHLTGAFMTAGQRREFEAGWPLHRGLATPRCGTSRTCGKFEKTPSSTRSRPSCWGHRSCT